MPSYPNEGDPPKALPVPDLWAMGQGPVSEPPSQQRPIDGPPSSKRRRALVAIPLVVLVMVAGTLGGLYLSSVIRSSTGRASASKLITPSVEQEVVGTTWSGFAAAVAEHDDTALAEYSTAALQEVVIGNASCGCTSLPVSFSSETFSVPRQASFPIYFLAELHGLSATNSSLTEEVVFEKTSSTSRWLVSHIGGFIDGHPFFDGPGSLDAAPPPLPHRLAKGPEAYARFFQRLLSSGTEIQPLPAGYWNSASIDSLIATARQTFEYRHSVGLKSTYTHIVGDVSPAFALEAEGRIYGGELCFDLQEKDTITAPFGSVIYQDQSRAGWGGWLSPGSYSNLRVQIAYDVCLYEPTDGHLFVSTVVGGVYHYTGTHVLGPRSSGSAA